MNWYLTDIMNCRAYIMNPLHFVVDVFHCTGIWYLCNLTSSVSALCVTLFIIAGHSNLNRICWFQTIAEIIRREYSWIQELVELVLDWGDDSNLFMKLSVKEIMWGYEDPLLKKVKAILQKYVNTTTFDDKFGLFYNVRICCKFSLMYCYAALSKSNKIWNSPWKW